MICQRVFRLLGRGHTESVYHKALLAELNASPLFERVESEIHVPVTYEDSYLNFRHTVGTCRIDVMYTDVSRHKEVLLELKAQPATILHGNNKNATEEQVRKYLRCLQVTAHGRSVDVAVVVNFRQAPGIDGVEEGQPVVEFLEVKTTK